MTTSNGEIKAVSGSENTQKSGYTVDNEGLLNNYAIEPPMYEEDGGALTESVDRVTVVDLRTGQKAERDRKLISIEIKVKTGMTEEV